MYVSPSHGYMILPTILLIEYQEKYKDRKPINVQGIVEKPKLYIFGQSGSSDVEQSSYTAVRIEDLQILSEPITADNGNIKIFDVMRVFSGDGPARQFEIGQQRGGNYPCVCGVHANDHGNFVLCYGISPLTLDERVSLIKSTRCFEELKKGNLNPFQNLKKDDLIEELESRDIDIHNMLRPELQENLSALLHGICRPPALMTTTPTLSTHHLNLNNYEIFGMEPLHDLSNFIQNIITELPSHISDKKLQKELEEFSKHTIGDKNQIKGSDARLYLVEIIEHKQYTDTNTLSFSLVIGIEISSWVEREFQRDGAAKKTDVPGYPVLYQEQQVSSLLQPWRGTINVEIGLENHQVRCLVDSGASFSCISQHHVVPSKHHYSDTQRSTIKDAISVRGWCGARYDGRKAKDTG
ncbi:Hypothetical predicted protein [Mytilus galloprovincialis]|uniref:Uncharacterized protein n=1 Tax=Mytilus galloprovincialis TaxID=29158 RepID=A0A8B6EXA1_MYTGA|nr:Hypothetical predicted protein [Mytilus galloprovincialis]